MINDNIEHKELSLLLWNKSMLPCLVVWPVLRGNGLICHEQRQTYNPHGILPGDRHVFVPIYTMG